MRQANYGIFALIKRLYGEILIIRRNPMYHIEATQT